MMELVTRSMGQRQDAPQTLPVRPWWRGRNPNLELVRQLYVEQGGNERDIARVLGISRERLAVALTGLGVQRGQRDRQACPLAFAELRRLLERGETTGSLARRYQVSWDTAGRWLSEAGLLPDDPKIDPERLRALYVDQSLTTREIAEQLDVSKSRVLRALAAAGISARTRSQRRPSGARAAVTDDALRQLYADPAMTVARAARHFTVSESYLRGRIALAGLTKRPGSFTPHLPEATRHDLNDRTPELYQQGWTLAQVAAELGTSTQSVRLALHRTQTPVRAGGGARPDNGQGRVLVDEMYRDPQIVGVLRAHHVRTPDSQRWRTAGPRETYAPLPLAADLLQALYIDVGLPMTSIALLCGVGTSSVRGRLLASGTTLRPNRQPSPWMQRRAAQPGVAAVAART